MVIRYRKHLLDSDHVDCFHFEDLMGMTSTPHERARKLENGVRVLAAGGTSAVPMGHHVSERILLRTVPLCCQLAISK